MTCQSKHPHNQNKTILQEHMSKQSPTQSRQNNSTRWHDKTNTNAMKTKQYYKITCQNKHPHNQDKTILQDHLPKQTPTLSRQNNITRLHVKNKHPHNQYKIILQDQMTKQTPTQSRQDNITRWHVKTNTSTIKTKQYYKITCQNKHPHNQDKIILQDQMRKQTPTQSRQNNITKWHDKKTPTQSRQNNFTRWHDKTNTCTIRTKQYYRIRCQNKYPHNQDKIILQDQMTKQKPTQDKTILPDDI